MGLWRKIFTRDDVQEDERAHEMRERRIEKLKALRELAEESGNEEALRYTENRLRILERLSYEAQVMRLERKGNGGG